MAATGDTDEVLAKSTFLTAYMSQHVDTLVAYILFFLQSKSWGGGASAKVKSENQGLAAADVKQPKMLKISSKEMTIQFVDARKGQKAAVRTVDIPFDPPMRGYEEVRPRLVEMKKEAEDAIGMTKRPEVRTYRLPTRRNASIIISLILLWVGVATQQDDYGTFGRIRRLTGGWWTVRATGMFMVAAHAAEAAFQFRSCQRFNMPLPQTLMWTVATFLLGIASLLEFRKVVREARIASISKTQ